MTILRKIISAVVLIAGLVVLVGICLKYPWSSFAEAFSPFNFDKVVLALNEFFSDAGNAIVLVVLGLLGVTLPGRAKK